MAAPLPTLKGTYINHSLPDTGCVASTQPAHAAQLKLISKRPIKAYLLKTVSQQALVFWMCKLQNVLPQ